MTLLNPQSSQWSKKCFDLNIRFLEYSFWGLLMTQEEWEKILDKQDRNMLLKSTIPDHDELIGYLRVLFPMTGISDKLFCNGFMIESVELLKHGIFLYEDGFFDCAFYTVRQSIENMNNMLFLSQNEDELVKWKAKERFPSDSHIKGQLQKINEAYSEIKESIPEVFDSYEELLKKANKYIHKQGFDTFYLHPWQQEKLMSTRTDLFVRLLKQSIGLVMIMNIVLDPLSFALSDPDVDAHIPFEPMTEHIPLGIFEKVFSDNIIERIKKTNFYKEFVDFFLKKEEMNDAIYTIIRFQHYNIEALDDIEKQIHLLNIWQALCFYILKSKIKVSHFYFQDDFLGYSTSIEPSHHLKEYRSNQFDKYTLGNGVENIEWNNMFISVYKVFNTYIILQHNELLSKSELSVVQTIIDENNLQYDKLQKYFDELL